MENFAGFKFSLRLSSIYAPLARARIFDMPTYSDMAGNKEASFGNGSSGAFDDDSPLAAKLEAQGPGPPAAGRPDSRGPARATHQLQEALVALPSATRTANAQRLH